jgi:hypothetical protein
MYSYKINKMYLNLTSRAPNFAQLLCPARPVFVESEHVNISEGPQEKATRLVRTTPTENNCLIKKNIPAQYASQKTFYELLVAELGLKHVSLKVNFNKTAFLELPTALASNFSNRLKIS